jgi:steroid delta-isomerase-like uncharacterized protein
VNCRGAAGPKRARSWLVVAPGGRAAIARRLAISAGLAFWSGSKEVAMATDNKAIMRQIVNEVWKQGKLDTIDALVAPSYVYHGPGGLEMRGPEGYKQLANAYRGAFPDMDITIEDLIAEGDQVVCRWTGRGTHKGELMGIAATGKFATVPGILISRFANGKLVEDHELFDEVVMFRQLGVTTIPAPAHT